MPRGSLNPDPISDPKRSFSTPVFRPDRPAFFLTFMSANFSFLKEMTIGCKTFLLVFPVISQLSKFTFTEPIHSIISICIIKSIRRSTQGSTDCDSWLKLGE